MNTVIINKKVNKSLQKIMHYQQNLDIIFRNGSIWKYRALRTLFAPYSSEYDQTTRDKKI